MCVCVDAVGQLFMRFSPFMIQSRLKILASEKFFLMVKNFGFSFIDSKELWDHFTFLAQFSY